MQKTTVTPFTSARWLHYFISICGREGVTERWNEWTGGKGKVMRLFSVISGKRRILSTVLQKCEEEYTSRYRVSARAFRLLYYKVENIWGVNIVYLLQLCVVSVSISIISRIPYIQILFLSVLHLDRIYKNKKKKKKRSAAQSKHWIRVPN